MAYNEFTLDALIEQFGLDVREETGHFAGVPPAPLSDLLRRLLDENVPLALAIGTEKARSELIIMPVLQEVRRQAGPGVSLFSGVDFTVDQERGLRGVCDFLLSLSPLQAAVRAPVVAVVEAKNDNIKPGLGQCVAEMLAAQTFNERRGNPIPAVYGVVTTGSDWRFLRLEGATVTLDQAEYYIAQAERVVGILLAMVGGARAEPSQGTAQ